MRVPLASDDAAINLAGITVTHSSAGTNDAVHSLTSTAILDVTGGTLSVTAGARLDALVTVDGGTLSIGGGSVSGAGSLVNHAGLTLANCTVNVHLENRGTLAMSQVTLGGPFSNEGTTVVQGIDAINGSVATTPGSTIRLQTAGGGTGQLTFAAGFTNEGAIELTGSGAGAASVVLVVTSGTLTNDAERSDRRQYRARRGHADDQRVGGQSRDDPGGHAAGRLEHRPYLRLRRRRARGGRRDNVASQRRHDRAG